MPLKGLLIISLMKTV